MQRPNAAAARVSPRMSPTAEGGVSGLRPACCSSNVNGDVKSLQGCGLAGRGGCAGHAVNPSMEARFSHPCEKTVLHSHPAPPSTGSWGPWVGHWGGEGDGVRVLSRSERTLTPFFITRRAATGTCQGPGGEAVRGLERQEPRRATWTYLRVPRTAFPPGQPSDAVRKQPAARGFHPFDASTASDPVPRRRSISTETPHSSRPAAAVAAPTYPVEA